MGFSTTSIHELVRIRIRDGRRMVPVASATARAAALGLGFRTEDAERVHHLVDRLSADIVSGHFDSPDEVDFTLIVGDLHGKIAIRIEDNGLPYPVERFSLEDDHLLGRQHLHGQAESIRFFNLGTEGNAVELVVARDPGFETHLEEEGEPQTDPVPHDAPITIRALLPEDAPGVARCVYRCYGYTYASDFLYYPDQILAMIERNLLRSFVGLNEHGEVVGHSGLLRDHIRSQVAESGMGLVDPRYRHHHLLESLKAHQSDVLDELELIGVFVDAVTVHPITQKVNAELGAHETGILLAEIPAFTTFRGFEDKAGRRGSVVVYYRTVKEAPTRDIYLPHAYRTLLDDIYAPLGLSRNVHQAERENDSIPEAGVLHVEIKGRRGLARIDVERGGADLTEAVAEHLRQFRLKRFDVVHLDLPLGDSPAMSMVDDLRALGFFFAAVIPELRHGDVLRLQYLNNVELDTEGIVLYTETSKRILEAILKDRPA